MKDDVAIEVLICGAGAAGLALAIELARRNVPFRLVEKMKDPFQGSRGKGLQPRTLEIFEDFGIVDRIFATGGPYPPQREYRGDGSFAESPSGAPRESLATEPYATPWMVPQFLTERVMRERLAELGHAPEFGCELVAFAQAPDGVTARLATDAGEEVMRARYLVGADGGRSFVRHALKIGFPGRTLGIRAVVADVVLTGLERDAWHRFNEGGMERQLALCPLAGTGLFQLQAPVPLEGEVDLSKEGLASMAAERTGRHDIRIESVSWASAYTMNARLADRYRVGRVFLVGDAAHIHPPTGGQGLNTSIQDAYNLGWKLAAVSGGAADALLDTYEEERRPIAADVLGLASRLLDAAKRGEVQRGREVHQLDLGYPGSSLAWQSQDPPRRLAAGDRAPDAPILGAGGQRTRLFDLFKGTHWTLLGHEASESPLPPRHGLHIHRVGAGSEYSDEGGLLREAYGVDPGDWVLVRPDGYIGAIASSVKVQALESRLRGVGLKAGAINRVGSGGAADMAPA